MDNAGEAGRIVKGTAAELPPAVRAVMLRGLGAAFTAIVKRTIASVALVTVTPVVVIPVPLASK